MTAQQLKDRKIKQYKKALEELQKSIAAELKNIEDGDCTNGKGLVARFNHVTELTFQLDILDQLAWEESQ